MVAPSLHFSGEMHIAGKRLFGPFEIACPAAEWTCILGPSGIGKTTLLRLFLGLETGGELLGSICASDGKPLADRIAYMAQSDLLFPWLSLRDNVAVGARLRGQTPDYARAERVIAQVGLAAHHHKKPAALSGGMRQRAALARTLMEDRPIVMLDEPLSALDACTRAEMQELLLDTLSGKTVVMVTHDPAEAARMADHIVVMTNNVAQVWPSSPQGQHCPDALLTHLRGLAA